MLRVILLSLFYSFLKSLCLNEWRVYALPSRVVKPIPYSIVSLYKLASCQPLVSLSYLAEHYRSLPPDSGFGEFEYDAILSEHDLNIGRLEKFLCSAQVRGVIVSYSLLLYLIVFQPFLVLKRARGMPVMPGFRGSGGF